MKKYNNLQTKRRFVSGKMIVGIDPANDKHQAAVIDSNGIIQGVNHVILPPWPRVDEEMPQAEGQ